MADKLKLLDKFCYLDDMLGICGGAQEVSGTRMMCAWVKFNELSPILIIRETSLKLKEKIYRAGVQNVLMYGVRK